MIIAPSLLAADFGRFAKETVRVEKAGAKWQVARTIRPMTKMFFDVHLMCSRPEILLEPFAKAGANQINIHVELGDQITPLFWKIRSLGMKVGLAINPPTAIGLLHPYIGQVDSLLIMTVNPGFGGQEFIHETLPKIQQAYAWREENKLSYRIGVDGGINFTTAAECARAGADTFISGTGLFGQRSLKAAIKKMIKVAEHSAPVKPAEPAVPGAMI